MTTTNNTINDLNEEDLNITENMNRPELERHFANNKEITYKGETIGIMDWENGQIDVLKQADNDDGYEIINEVSFTQARPAIVFAIDYLLSLNEETASATVPGSKAKAKTKKKAEPKYEGPRTVKVFGREIYTEMDDKLTHDQIRQKLVDDYNCPNFKAGKVFYDFDSSTGTLEVLLKFEVKG